MSATLSWDATSNPAVTGYNIYYGPSSQQYTNSLSVGLVTNAVISGLVANTPYFFAATAHNSTNAESPFSNQTAFQGVNATPNSIVNIKPLPRHYSNDPLLFSLDATAPPGATINRTSGIVSWTPEVGYALTTNNFNIIVTDSNNPAVNITENVTVIVSDYLGYQLGATAVYAGATGSLPLTEASSSSVTNLQITLNWPASQLSSPTLTFFSPIVSGSLKKVGSQLNIQLQTAANQPLTGTNVVCAVNFQAVSGLPTEILSVTATNASGTTASGASYANVLTSPGEVAVVGTNSMLRPQTSTSSGRVLTLYAQPGSYQLLYTTSLVQPVTWTALTSYAQTNAAQTVSLDPTIPVIFYRLLKL